MGSWNTCLPAKGMATATFQRTRAMGQNRCALCRWGTLSGTLLSVEKFARVDDGGEFVVKIDRGYS